MPFSSAEISASIGAFQGQSMNNVAYSQMIGMGAFNQGQVSDRMAGGMMSRVGGMAGPMAMGGLGLMGLDPMSLGLRAGMSAWGGGAGMMGAGMAGMGAFGLASGGIGAAGYMGNQMMQGAQQQAHLNNVLRSNHGFMNSSGGQGFGRNDMAQIGGMMRSATHQFGPEGQVTGFGELTNLVQNMGKMGMTTGVRDVQEFGRKFREMLTVVKTVAKELGSTLEEAQQFISAQRNSGIFRAVDQAKFAAQARGTSISGGVALSEVTAMASIGSQISRSVGGLGRSGAYGGMRAIGQVGSALQVGALSEETIYNATGLTGAEGRQAMASNMMASGANFLKGGRGRRFLASMAGKDGSLDEESVANWMTGDMSTGETMSQAHRNLGKVGRANFIRNEGRLRGSALERFGALAPTMAYQQWLSSRGHDPNNMDDRSMLAFQRFSGMGRDEADAAIGMVQKLPEMMKQQRTSAGDDEYSQKLSSARRGAGVEGLKRRFEQIREGIQGKMQQAGADVFTSGSDMIEQWWNKLTGIYERRVTEGIDELAENAKMGGRGLKDFSMALGGGGGMVGSSLGTAGINQAMQGMGAGGGVSGNRQFYESSRQGMFAAKMGGASTGTAETNNFISKNKDWFRDSYTTKLAGFEGERRISEFGNMLKLRADSGDPEAQALHAQWKAGGKNGKAALLAAMEKKGGISDKVSLGKTWELPDSGLGGGSFSTLREGDVAVGRQMMGDAAFLSGPDEGFTFRSALGAVGSGAGLIAGTAADLFGSPILSALGYKPGQLADELAMKGGSVLGGGEEMAAAMGGYARSKEGSRMMAGLMTGEGTAAQDRLMELQHLIGRGAHGKGSLSTAERAEFDTLTQTSLGAEFGKLADQGFPASGMEALRTKAKDMLGRDVTDKELGMFFNNGRAAMGAQARDNIERISERTLDSMSKRRESLQSIGVASEETIRMGGGGANQKGLVLSKAAASKLGAAGSQAAQLAISTMEMSAELAGMSADDPRKAELLQRIYGQEGQLFEDIAGMSTADKKKLARGAAGSDLDSMAGESMMRERRLGSLMKSRGAGGKRQGIAGAMGSMLGVDLSAEELDAFQGRDAASTAKFLADKAGIKDSKFQGELQKAIEAAKGGKTGTAADLLARGIAQSDEAKKKLGDKNKDPMQEMTEAVKQGNRFLEAIAKGNDRSAAILSTIAGNTASGSNPEASPGSGGRAPGDGRPGA